MNVISQGSSPRNAGQARAHKARPPVAIVPPSSSPSSPSSASASTSPSSFSSASSWWHHITMARLWHSMSHRQAVRTDSSPPPSAPFCVQSSASHVHSLAGFCHADACNGAGHSLSKTEETLNIVHIEDCRPRSRHRASQWPMQLRSGAHYLSCKYSRDVAR